MAKAYKRFGVEELAICLSHYDLGAIESVQPFDRGSHLAAKVVIVSRMGKFLFKRRANGRDDPPKVALSHQIQLALAERDFPLPRLIGTRDENNSMLALKTRIYEMFEFVSGEPHDGSAEGACDAGVKLGLYHKLLEGFRTDYHPPHGSYHNAKAVLGALAKAASPPPNDARDEQKQIAMLFQTLQADYTSSIQGANKLGVGAWAEQIVHGDWHPGNLLFRDRGVAAVIDHDGARMEPRVTDLANGAMQFSIVRDQTAQPGARGRLSRGRFKSFMRGYDSVNVISVAEVKAVPYLMCEAMIAEAVTHVATGHSPPHTGGRAFLELVASTAKWILRHVDLLQAALEK